MFGSLGDFKKYSCRVNLLHNMNKVWLGNRLVMKESRVMTDENVSIIPDLQSSIICDDVRQENNGKFMLIGLFDSIGAAKLPLVYPRLFMVTRWCSGEGQFIQRTKIIAPDQTTVVVQGKDISMKLVSTEATATNVEVFMNVTFNQAGTYWVETSVDNDLKLRYPLRVGQITATQKPEG